MFMVEDAFFEKEILILFVFVCVIAAGYWISSYEPVNRSTSVV